MTEPILTIGMATHTDFDGLQMTLQSLRLYHDLTDCEIVVVDNNPTEKPGQGNQVKAFIEYFINNAPCPARYVPMPSPVGTSRSRDRVFAEAAGVGVVCMDSHVMLAPGAVDKLKSHYRSGASGDIITGPMLQNGLQIYATHYSDFWRGEMWGIWGQAWFCTCGKFTFDVEAIEEAPYPDGVQFAGHKMPPVCQFHKNAMGWEVVTDCPECGAPFPFRQAWIQHEQALEKFGYRRFGYGSQDEQIEIPGMGLGLFSCRKKDWPGFHPASRQFGGEELYIHEKFRRAGGRAMSLSWLRWWHRFGRPCDSNVPYPLSNWGKVRNYVLEFKELGRDLDPIYQHFVVEGKKLDQIRWDYLVEDPLGREDYPGNVVGSQVVQRQLPAGPAELQAMDVDQLYQWTLDHPRDLQEHFPKIKELASQCSHVTAFTKRTELNAPIFAGRPKAIVHYCTEPDTMAPLYHEIVEKNYSAGRRTEMFSSDSVHSLSRDIEPTDMLILAQIHTRDRILGELNKYAPLVKKWIVVQGTSAFGEVGEGGNIPGLLVGIREYIKSNPQWKRVYQADNQYGLTVLNCDPRERTIDRGPGTELHYLLETIGISSTATCSCRAKSRQMDVWGVQGCKVHFDEIVAWMKDGQTQFGWSDKIKAAAGVVKTGLFLRLNWLDPFPGLITESIRLAEEKDKQWEEYLQSLASPG